jgi:hypothetical protein
VRKIKEIVKIIIIFIFGICHCALSFIALKGTSEEKNNKSNALMLLPNLIHKKASERIKFLGGLWHEM